MAPLARVLLRVESVVWSLLGALVFCVGWITFGVVWITVATTPIPGAVTVVVNCVILVGLVMGRRAQAGSGVRP
jgi:hypothetical protein